MAKDVTLRQLRYFVAAARAGQFSMAAASEHVSQSAITNAVIALEQALGARLFDRGAHGVTLTADGHDFYNHARHVLESVRDALHKPRSGARASSGTVRIAASYAVLGYFLPELLARFRASFPAIELDLRDMDRPAIEEAVLRGDIDLGVTLVSNVERLGEFGHQILIRSRRQLWTAPSHPLAMLPSVSLADVAAHPSIVLTVDEGEASMMRYWRAAGLEPNIAFRTGSMEAVRGLVANGFGVTVLSDMLFRAWSLDGTRIDARPLVDPIPPMEVGLLWRPSGEIAPAARQLQEFLIQAHST
ncbi:LysR family transcriptional regulator [Paraburkholderia sp. RP-4-7]|jgi:DNA-binding transcriptional LysR family regulator|uniref:LysR family transcriptional regulator n=1 Tax=Paraburkholderia polaris TaxID=2728848 RepID=A0A848I960_9BURK|nr:LysR substrate-binding domain-containing protein [Paraburkholderia polaris]NML97752.1 LysR family transcriptional regulator [Paraburkholderia polaris]